MHEYNVEQALEVLKEHKITESVQTVRRWLRDGTLIGHSPGDRRQAGWRIKHDDLMAFIEARIPPLVPAVALDELRAENARLLAENVALRAENERLRGAQQPTSFSTSEPYWKIGEPYTDQKGRTILILPVEDGRGYDINEIRMVRKKETRKHLGFVLACDFESVMKNQEY